jgi:hypothetical protein
VSLIANRAYAQRRRAATPATLCSTCCTRAPRLGLRTCDACITLAKARTAKRRAGLIPASLPTSRRARAIATGWCATCFAAAPAPGSQSCEPCRVMLRARRKALRDAERAGVEMPQRYEHVPGAERYLCLGYLRKGHTVPQIWTPQRLCLDCQARKDRDLGVVYLVMSVEEDRADELLALSYGAIAARGR